MPEQRNESSAARRLRECVERWPECESGAYDPRCCRFPKSCSCTSYPGTWTETDLEPRPESPAAQDRFRNHAELAKRDARIAQEAYESVWERTGEGPVSVGTALAEAELLARDVLEMTIFDPVIPRKRARRVLDLIRGSRG